MFRSLQASARIVKSRSQSPRRTRSFAIQCERLEPRELLAGVLTPGNPVNPGTPTTFSGVGGTIAAGGAINALNAFRSAIGGADNGGVATPQAGGSRTINWDGVKLDGSDFGGGANTTVIVPNKDVGIPLNRFQERGVFFEQVYAVANDGFASVNPNATGLFPAFSANNTFAMFNDNTIDFSFVLPSNHNTTPLQAGARGFGAIFINSRTPNTSSIEYFHGAQSLGKFFVPTSNSAGDPEFLGILFGSPIVTKVTLTLGTDVLFNFDGANVSASGVNNPPTHNLVVTDDFVYPEPIALADGVPVVSGAQGTLNAAVKFIAAAGSPVTATVATFSDSDPTANAREFTATIHWGDGQASNGVVTANAQGGFDVMGANVYQKAGALPVSVDVQDFAGDADLAVTTTALVARGTSNTSLQVAPSAAIAGQAATLTAVVTGGAGSPVAAGAVVFADGVIPIGVALLDAQGRASLITTSLALGAHSLTATFIGDNNLQGAISPAVQAVVRSDVTNQFAITLGPVKRSGRRFVQHVAIKNNGATLPGALALVLDRLTKGAVLLNASGVTRSQPPLGSPFVALVLGAANQLAAGDSIGVDLVFRARSSRIRYTPRVLAGTTL
jgi:Bacterial Ig-like domain (group 3)